VDITTCHQIYSVARIKEGRQAAERFEALELYFYTNLMAEMLGELARQDRRHVPSPDLGIGNAPLATSGDEVPPPPQPAGVN
jgi:hypothetical protein